MTRFALSGLAALVLLGCGTPARQDVGGKTWTEVRGSVFVLRSDADPKRVLGLAHDMELFLAVVRAATDFDFDRLRHPLRIYAIEDAELQGGLWLGQTTGKGGEHNDTAYGSIVLAAMGRYVDGTRRVVNHEFTHFLLDQTGLFVPRWYHEGLADFLSTIRRREDLVSVGHVAKGRLQALLALERLPLSDVVSAYAYPKGFEEVLRFYATAWLFVHYLQTARTDSGDIVHRLGVDYLERLSRGEPWDEAFTAAFGTDPEGLDAELEMHQERLAAGQLRLAHLRAGEQEIASLGPQGVASPTRVASDLAEVLLGYQHGDATARAIGLLESALAVDPDDATANATLAWAKARRFRPPAGEAEIARALARGARSPRVQLQAGRMRLVRAGDDGSLDRAEIGRAREHFRRAVALDPALAAAWAEFGRTYLLEGLDEESPDPGIEALESALARLPSDSGVHLALGRLLARRGEPDRARAHLELVLRWSWSEQERATAEAALATLGG